MDLTTIDHLLTTTRSVRLRLDLSRPVDPEIIRQCIEIAIQAPTASNSQHWHFVIIADADKRAQVGELYRRSYMAYHEANRELDAAFRSRPDDPYAVQMLRMRKSALYLAEHMHEVPVLVIPCQEGRVENAGAQSQAGFYGSILPATWSLMLALRARGLGSAWTTLHLRYEKEVAGILGIPDTVTQAALLPVAYFKGEDFKPARRLPIEDRLHWDTWDPQPRAPATRLT
jgi:nitroreductase